MLNINLVKRFLSICLVKRKLYTNFASSFSETEDKEQYKAGSRNFATYIFLSLAKLAIRLVFSKNF